MKKTMLAQVKVMNKVSSVAQKTKRLLCNNDGALTVEFMVLVILAVVVGATVLNYFLKMVGVEILPTVSAKIKALFDFK